MKTAALGVAGFFLVSLLAAQTLSGPEIPVSGSRDVPTLSQVAMAANGEFTVVWESRGATAGGASRIWMRRFAASGKARGREVLVARPGAARAQQTDAQIAMTAEGGSMIVWQTGNTVFRSVVFGRCFDAKGKPLGPAFQLSQGGGALQVNAHVAAAPDGSFVATWAGGPNPFGAQADIFVRRFAAEGTPLGAAFQAVSPAAGWQNHPRVAVDGNGDFLVGWLSDPDGSNHCEILARRFDAEGRPLGDALRVSPASASVKRNGPFALTRMDDGESLFLWIATVPEAPPTADGFLHVGILGQRIAGNGTRLGDPFEVHEVRFEGHDAPVGAVVPGGEFFVAWGRSPSTAGEQPVVLSQLVSNAGVSQGPTVQVNLLGEGSQPSLAFAPNGRGVVTWTAMRGRKVGIFARLAAP